MRLSDMASIKQLIDGKMVLYNNHFVKLQGITLETTTLPRRNIHICSDSMGNIVECTAMDALMLGHTIGVYTPEIQVQYQIKDNKLMCRSCDIHECIDDIEWESDYSSVSQFLTTDFTIIE